jgi:hypothetical protein
LFYFLPTADIDDNTAVVDSIRRVLNVYDAGTFRRRKKRKTQSSPKRLKQEEKEREKMALII